MVGGGTVPHLGLKLGWRGEGMELAGCGMASTMGREEEFEGRVFGRLRAHFLPSYHPISAKTVKLENIALNPCRPWRPKREKPLVLP